MTEIWQTDWIFYTKLSASDKAKGMKPIEFVVRAVVCKRIPVRFILNEGIAYKRTLKSILPKTLDILEEDRYTGLKKFKIKFIKKIGITNENTGRD